MIALYRFRPEARETVRAAVASALPDDGARGTPLAEVALTLGASQSCCNDNCEEQTM